MQIKLQPIAINKMIWQYTDMEKETRKAVSESPLSYEQIAQGSGVGLSWLQKFMTNKMGDYGVRRIAKVQKFLKKEAKK